jgi:hypothetical protein
VPIVYHIDREEGLLTSLFTGNVSPQDILEFYDELRESPDFRPDIRQIAEFRVDEAEWGPEDMKEVVVREPFGPGAHRAFVGPVDLIYGLSRMYSSFAETMGEGGTIRVFRTVEEARVWLDSLPRDAES